MSNLHLNRRTDLGRYAQPIKPLDGSATVVWSGPLHQCGLERRDIAAVEALGGQPAGGTAGGPAGWLQLATSAGSREHFNPTSGGGLGRSDLTWTAALMLDILPASAQRPG